MYANALIKNIHVGEYGKYETIRYAKVLEIQIQQVS